MGDTREGAQIGRVLGEGALDVRPLVDVAHVGGDVARVEPSVRARDPRPLHPRRVGGVEVARRHVAVTRFLQ